MSYRRRPKTTPLKEVIFLIVTVGASVTALWLGTLSSNFETLLWTGLLITLLAGVFLFLFFVFKQRQKQKVLRALEIAQIDEMSGTEFEKYVAALLKSQGYKTKLTPVNDYGVDIVATKNGIKTAVQVKRYSKALDQKPVREAVAGKSIKEYGCTEAMVVTNSTFTKAARFLAKENRCVLVDREILGEWISVLSKRSS